MNNDLKENEEAKRQRCWDPLQRWKVLQETIAWVDSQQAVPRNSPQGSQEKYARMTRACRSDT